MKPSLRSQIESLWFEPGTAADAAAAANKHLARVKWVSPDEVRRIWTKAQQEGRLPDLDRDAEFRAGRGEVLADLGQVYAKRVQA